MNFYDIPAEILTVRVKPTENSLRFFEGTAGPFRLACRKPSGRVRNPPQGFRHLRQTDR